MRQLLLISLLVSAAAAPAAASSITLNPDQDNTLIQSTTGALSNALGDLYVGRTNQADADSRRRGVVRFDVAGSVPSGATITSAKLRLYLNRTSDSSSRTVTLHEVGASWGEGTSFFNGGVGASSTTNDATWIHRFYSATSWTASGGDYAGTGSQTCSVGLSYQYYDWNSNAAMVADVQGWLDTPASNHGWVVIGDESVGHTARRFTSREGSVDELPLLVIEYTVDGFARVATTTPQAHPRVRLAPWQRLLGVKDLDGDGVDDLLIRDDRAGQLLGGSPSGRSLTTWILPADTDPADPLATR